MIVDDHALFRAGLALVLEQDQRISVVGQGRTGKEAVDLAHELAPEVLLLDVEMGDGNSADKVIRQIGRSAPTVRVVVLTMHQDTVLRNVLIQAGAVGFVTKNVLGSELVTFIESIRHRKRISAVGVPPMTKQKDLLSDRELQVLLLIGQAQSNRGISEQLSIAEGTVKRHTTNIYSKLEATSRIDAVRKASRLGLL